MNKELKVLTILLIFSLFLLYPIITTIKEIPSKASEVDIVSYPTSYPVNNDAKLIKDKNILKNKDVACILECRIENVEVCTKDLSHCTTIKGEYCQSSCNDIKLKFKKFIYDIR